MSEHKNSNLGYITRATNQGEGGMFALLTLFHVAKSSLKPRLAASIVLIGIFGACLLYGDGMITPAISVHSAVEGLALLDAKLGTDLAHYVVPISAAIIFALFLVQRHGTSRIGRAFGPIMVFWFLTLAILGIINIVHFPGVFLALSPTMESIFCCITATTALFSWGWFCSPSPVVRPCMRISVILAGHPWCGAGIHDFHQHFILSRRPSRVEMAILEGPCPGGDFPDPGAGLRLRQPAQILLRSLVSAGHWPPHLDHHEDLDGRAGHGFAESPKVFDDLCHALSEKTKIRRSTITFYQSREVILTNGTGKMARWRKRLFVMLSRISRPAPGYFDLPTRQVIELGIQIDI